MNILELRDRWRYCLMDMETLSEVSAANIGGNVRGGGSKSAPPPGVSLGPRRDLRDLSMHDYWRAKYDSAKGSYRQLQVFLFLAERDLSRAQRRQPMADPHESREGRERRVLSQYEGLSPLEAALAEDCSEAWIRKVRSAAGVDPQTGSHRIPA